MAGTYGSTLRFFYPSFNNVVKYDSLKHYSWDVTADSTITMRDFPVCKLDSAIVISKDNRPDIDEIEERYLKGLTFHFVENVNEVLAYALLDEQVNNPIAITVPEESKDDKAQE